MQERGELTSARRARARTVEPPPPHLLRSLNQRPLPPMLDPETFARKAADVLGLYPGPAVMEVPRLKEENPSITQARLRELVSPRSVRSRKLDRAPPHSRKTTDFLMTNMVLLQYYPVEDPPEDKDAVDACFVSPLLIPCHHSSRHARTPWTRTRRLTLTSLDASSRVSPQTTCHRSANCSRLSSRSAIPSRSTTWSSSSSGSFISGFTPPHLFRGLFATPRTKRSSSFMPWLAGLETLDLGMSRQTAAQSVPFLSLPFHRHFSISNPLGQTSPGPASDALFLSPLLS